MADSRQVADRSGRIFTTIFLVCACLIGFALYLQHIHNLDPCPWCVVQRIVFIAIGLLALLAGLHRPSGWGVGVYATLLGLLALGGVAAAGYHLYIQADPERAMACAGSMVEKVLDQSRLGRIIPPLFMYDGPCTLKPWSLLGMSIPAWSLTWFVILTAVATAAPFVARRR
jgi:protein dithiol:quinone oxidoreductase